MPYCWPAVLSTSPMTVITWYITCILSVQCTQSFPLKLESKALTFYLQYQGFVSFRGGWGGGGGGGGGGLSPKSEYPKRLDGRREHAHRLPDRWAYSTVQVTHKSCFLIP